MFSHTPSLPLASCVHLLSPMRSEVERNPASLACMALLSAVTYTAAFHWSCWKCGYNYQVHFCSHSLPLTLWYLVLGPAFPCKPPCSFLALPAPLSLLLAAPGCGRSPLLHTTALPHFSKPTSGEAFLWYTCQEGAMCLGIGRLLPWDASLQCPQGSLQVESSLFSFSFFFFF